MKRWHQSIMEKEFKALYIAQTPTRLGCNKKRKWLMKQHQLPDYLIKSFLRHVSKIVDHVEYKGCSRVADAVRLTKKDLKKIESLISK